MITVRCFRIFWMVFLINADHRNFFVKGSKRQGISSTYRRVFTVSIEEHPYQVAIIQRPLNHDFSSQHYNQRIEVAEFDFGQSYSVPRPKLIFRCAGTIITNSCILTAASCTQMAHSDPRQLLVQIGSDSLRSGGDILNVAEIKNHRHFHPGRTDYDISILKLEDKLTWNRNVRPIRLPGDKVLPIYGDKAMVIGWRYSDGHASNVSHDLLGEYIRIFHLQTCKDIYQESNIILGKKQICAGSFVHGPYAGLGEYGTPLIVDGVQYGIMTPALGVFTSIVSFKRFIHHNAHEI